MSDRGPGPDPAAGDTGFTQLRTSRLVLRRFRPDDAASLRNHRSAALLERVGMRREAHRLAADHHSAPVDTWSGRHKR